MKGEFKMEMFMSVLYFMFGLSLFCSVIAFGTFFKDHDSTFLSAGIYMLGFAGLTFLVYGLLRWHASLFDIAMVVIISVPTIMVAWARYIQRTI